MRWEVLEASGKLDMSKIATKVIADARARGDSYAWLISKIRSVGLPTPRTSIGAAWYQILGLAPCGGPNITKHLGLVDNDSHQAVGFIEEREFEDGPAVLGVVVGDPFDNAGNAGKMILVPLNNH